MDTRVTVGASRALHLSHALLIYSDRVTYGHAAYVTLHEVRHAKRGAPRLGAGRPADLGFLRALSESLQTAVPAEVLPEYVLCRTPTVICWWSPAARRPMHFEEHSQLAGVTGKIFPHPPLVWKLEGRSLYVRALREDHRPDASTKLCVAPYWNTDLNGRVCLGDMRRPERIGVDNLRAWEDGYFGSLFTGQNGTGDRIQGRGGLVSLWRGLARAGRDFPARRLVDAGEVLARFIGGGGRA